MFPPPNHGVFFRVGFSWLISALGPFFSPYSSPLILACNSSFEGDKTRIKRSHTISALRIPTKTISYHLTHCQLHFLHVCNNFSPLIAEFASVFFLGIKLFICKKTFFALKVLDDFWSFTLFRIFFGRWKHFFLKFSRNKIQIVPKFVKEILLLTFFKSVLFVGTPPNPHPSPKPPSF